MTPGTRLPSWRSVLAVVAHPDDESFGLGAVLAAFAATGTAVSVLCLTRGEASTLHGVAGDLRQVRAEELAAAARVLGLEQVHLEDYPDGHLQELDLDELAAHVVAAARATDADGLVGFDPSGVTGHPDHVWATAAAVRGAEALGLPVLGWTLPAEVADQLRRDHGVAFSGHEPHELDLIIAVDRTLQRQAISCHPSQALPGSVLWHRLELLGDREHLRWLRQPQST